MLELKIHYLVDEDGTKIEYYKPSEVDKVIAALEDKLRHYPMMVALLETDKKEIAELKARIAQLEDDNALLRRNNEELRSKNEGLLYALADAETDLAMATRWRKCSEELPPAEDTYICAYRNKNKDDGIWLVDEAVWDGEKWSNKFDFWEDIIYWQFKPKAPEVK